MCVYFIYCKGFVVTHVLPMKKMIILDLGGREIEEKWYGFIDWCTHTQSLFFYTSFFLCLRDLCVILMGGATHTYFFVSCLYAFFYPGTVFLFFFFFSLKLNLFNLFWHFIHVVNDLFFCSSRFLFLLFALLLLFFFICSQQPTTCTTNEKINRQQKKSLFFGLLWSEWQAWNTSMWLMIRKQQKNGMLI